MHISAAIRVIIEEPDTTTNTHFTQRVLSLGAEEKKYSNYRVLREAVKLAWPIEPAEVVAMCATTRIWA